MKINIKKIKKRVGKMTYKKYAEIVRSAVELSEDLFVSRWLMMPECESIRGFTPEDLDASSNRLRSIYHTLNMPAVEIRKKMGLSQKKFAYHFCIPLRTAQNWEIVGGCPVYTRLMLMQLCGMFDPVAEFGIEDD